MFLQRLVVLAMLCAPLVAVPRSLAAQTTTAPSPASCATRRPVVPGATMRASRRHQCRGRHRQTRRTLLAARAGGRPLPVGGLTGFQTFQSPGVVVRVNDEVRLDVGLRVGAVPRR